MYFKKIEHKYAKLYIEIYLKDEIFKNVYVLYEFFLYLILEIYMRHSFAYYFILACNSILYLWNFPLPLSFTVKTFLIIIYCNFLYLFQSAIRTIPVNEFNSKTKTKILIYGNVFRLFILLFLFSKYDTRFFPRWNVSRLRIKLKSCQLFFRYT